MGIIIKPIVTEKMTVQGEKLNRYGFIVDRDANKIQIKAAVYRYKNNDKDRDCDCQQPRFFPCKFKMHAFSLCRFFSSVPCYCSL